MTADKLRLLELERDALVERLNLGYQKCEEAARTANATRFDDHWISLLRTYESVQGRIDREKGVVAYG
jgi:hypothetical protein